MIGSYQSVSIPSFRSSLQSIQHNSLEIIAPSFPLFWKSVGKAVTAPQLMIENSNKEVKFQNVSIFLSIPSLKIEMSVQRKARVVAPFWPSQHYVSLAVPETISLGVEVVLITFRTGLHVNTVAAILELQHDGISLAFPLSGMTDAETQRVSSNFHEDDVLKLASQKDIRVTHFFRVCRYRTMPPSVRLVMNV